ncbi:MAG: hypothetical protein ACI84D_003704, partial [Thalassolituus oleivorans]
FVTDVLSDGGRRGREKAAETMERVRSAVGLITTT